MEHAHRMQPELKRKLSQMEHTVKERKQWTRNIKGKREKINKDSIQGKFQIQEQKATVVLSTEVLQVPNF